MDLNKFDINTLRNNPIILIIGKRATGKSFLIRDITNHQKNVDFDLIINPTEECDKFYKTQLFGKFIHTSYKPFLLKDLLNNQKKLMNTGNMKKKGLIFDCCLTENEYKKDKNLRECLLNGRCYKINMISSIQYPMKMSPENISNTDYIFIFKENIISNKKQLYEYYGGLFPTFKEFSDILDKYTNNFNCLVIDITSKSNNIKECIYWYNSSS
jgi:hypothetical protein